MNSLNQLGAHKLAERKHKEREKSLNAGAKDEEKRRYEGGDGLSGNILKIHQAVAKWVHIV